MKTIDEIRRSKLDMLIKEHRSLREFSEYVDKSPSQISQLKNGAKDSKTGKERGMSNEMARYLEEKTGKPRGWMDFEDDGEIFLYLPAIKTEITAINGDVVEIPSLALEKTMPDNCKNFNFPFIHGLKVSKQWAENKLNINDMNKLAYMHNYGGSMQGTINDGDVLLVDTGSTQFLDNAIYVFEINNKYIIRRAHLRLDNTVEISSDNNPIKTSEILSNAIEYKTIGRVAYLWKGQLL